MKNSAVMAVILVGIVGLAGGGAGTYMYISNNFSTLFEGYEECDPCDIILGSKKTQKSKIK